MASDNIHVPVANHYRPCGHGGIEDENIRCHFCECYCKSGIKDTPFKERYDYFIKLLSDDVTELEDCEIIASRKYPCYHHITTAELHQLMDDRNESYELEVEQWK